jgi:3-oxoadipate enol-lactonase
MSRAGLQCSTEMPHKANAKIEEIGMSLSEHSSLSYHVQGHGQPLVWLHAFPLDRTMWDAQTQEFARDYRVITLDVFGFGESQLPAEAWSMTSMSEAIVDVLMKLNIQEPVVMIGLSMGGYIAIDFAHHFPERLRGLILADTRAEADSVDAKTGREKSIAMVQARGSIAQVEAMEPKALGKTTRASRPEVIETFRMIGSRQSPDAVVSALKALRDRADSTVDLANIAVPTLVLVGEEDEITPLAAAQVLVDHIPGAKMVVIPQAGHLSNLENPVAFNQAVREFISTFEV